MRDNYKNKNKDLPDFLRYSRGEMTGKERNDFERELQKDPFAEEAMEGLASISPEEASKDIANLKKRLKTRTETRQKFIIYRIAASVAVLMIISSVFIIVERNKAVRQLSEKTEESQILEITEGKPLRAPSAEEVANRRMAIMYEEKAGKSPDKKTTTVNNNTTSPIGGVKIAAEKTVDQATAKETKAVEEYASADNIAAPQALLTREKSETRKSAKKMEAISDSQLMVSPDTSVSALSGLVAAGYGRARAETGKDDNPTGYSPPEPEGGKTAFEKYIQENLHHPDSLTSGQGVVVEISFLVLTDGKIDSIKIVRSPGKSFSDEAIRLLKSGPQWKPAQKYGNRIEEEVRIKINFRYNLLLNKNCL